MPNIFCHKKTKNNLNNFFRVRFVFATFKSTTAENLKASPEMLTSASPTIMPSETSSRQKVVTLFSNKETDLDPIL